MKKTFLIISICHIFVFTMAFSASALDSPHNPGNDINCPSCHFSSSSPPAWYTQPPDPDNPDSASSFNRLCWSCHNDGIAPFEKTHSNFAINGEAGWSRECRDCHHAHDQRQFRRWGSGSYLYSGPSNAVTATMITKTGAGWTANQWQGMLVAGNISYPNFNYRILSNTPDTLTVEGTINTTYVKAGNTFAITYGKLVKDVVNAKDVKFIRQTGSNSFADGDTTYNGICEVCHTQTTYHRNNASGDHTHNVAAKCTVCHDHKEGFRASCNACHGNPPESDLAGPDGLVATPSPTGSVKGMTHVRHATGGSNYSFICDTCHYSGMPVTPVPDNRIQIGFDLFGGAWPGAGTTYKGQALNAPYSYEYTNGTTEGTTTFQCTNIYCHGRKPDGTVWGSGNNTGPTWNGNVACGDCHKATNADSPTPGSHSKHTAAAAYNFSCGLCHKDPNTNKSLHVNNKSEVVFSSDWKTSGGSYSGTNIMLDAYGQCTNVYCHSTVQTSPPGGTPLYRTTPTWGDNDSLTCQACHYDSESDPDLLTGSHRKHFEYYPDFETSCAYCHNNNNIDDECFACHGPLKWIPEKHVNGNIEVAFFPFLSGTEAGYSGTSTPGDAYGRCQNIYCHSNATAVSTGVITANTTPFWGSTGPLACTACHAYPPDYANGSPKANSHATHTSHGVGACSNCHYLTTTDGATIGGRAYHANMEYNLQAKPGLGFTYTYNSSGGTCSNISCHFNGTATWGGTVACGGCHAATNQTLTTGSHATHLASLKGPNGVITTSINCDTCHGAGATSGAHTGHGNGSVNFADENALGSTNVCTDCHSPLGTYDGVNDSAIGAKPNWIQKVYSGNELKFGKEKWCAGCHDESPSVVLAVSAPKVIGDESAATAYGTGYGFYKTGHGLPGDQVYPWTTKPGDPQQRNGAGLACDACHDFSSKHIDGAVRTYETPGTSAKYQAGYRLKSINGAYPLAVPRKYVFGDSINVRAEDFSLCLSCHDSQAFVNQFGRATNFRDDSDIPWHNDHYYHLAQHDTYGFGPMWQSDWKQPADGSGDSRAQCVQCHNVHGSTRLAMVNDGKLVNREPGIRVMFATATTGVPSGLTLPDSIYAAWIPDDFGPSKPDSNCTQTCHGGPPGGYSFYYRTPYAGPDTAKPTISDMGPANGATGVAPGSNLSFTLSDVGNGNGVDLSTFTLALSGDKGYSRSYTWVNITKSGAPDSFNLILDPDTDFGGSEIITVTVNVSDFSGNALTPLAWSFTTTSIPVPAGPTIGVPITLSATSIRWNFTDNASDETGFRLHDGSDVTMVEQGTPDLSYLDEFFLAPDTLYTRHVHAYNTYGESAPGANASRATLSNEPTGAEASKGTYADKITVSWSSGGAQSGYRVYRDGLAGGGTPVYDGPLTTFDDPVADTNNHAYYVYSKNREGELSSGYSSDTGWTSGGGGPQTITLHPLGEVAGSTGIWTTVGGAWADILDSNDGDGTYVNHDVGSGTDIFYVNMDDLASCSSVTNIRISAYIRVTDGPGTGVYGVNTNFNIGYKTGTLATKWKGSTQIPGGTANYTLIQSDIYTVDSDNGPLDCADINNLQLAVRRLSTGAHQDRVTEVYAEVTYVP